MTIVELPLELTLLDIFQCRPWRMNLMASSSKDTSLFFVAVLDSIYCFRSSTFTNCHFIQHQKLQIRAFLKIPPPPIHHDNNPSLSRIPINFIRIVNLGDQEYLVSVDDAGSIRLYKSDALNEPPLLFENGGSSTWGCAAHAPSRLLAVR